MDHDSGDKGEWQHFSGRLKDVLLACVDMADTASDAKAMILTMYESGLLSVAETYAHIHTRGLEAE